jgi:hypothetical protein
MMRMPLGTLPVELASLLPVSTDRPVLLGGLPVDLGATSYLTGGEPDVFISKMSSEIADVYSVDGVTYPVPAGGGQIALSELNLTAGSHEFILGPSRLTIYTAPNLGRVVPKAAGGIGFRFTGERGDYRIQRAGAEILDEDAGHGAVVVCGARVTGGALNIPEGSPPPLVLPRGRRRYFAIGSQVGNVDEVSQPQPPAWLKKIPLFASGFEYYPHFDVEWLLLEETNNWVARQVGSESSLQPPRPDRAGSRVWCGAVLAGRQSKVLGDSKRWREYVLAAHDEAW